MPQQVNTISLTGQCSASWSRLHPMTFISQGVRTDTRGIVLDREFMGTDTTLSNTLRFMDVGYCQGNNFTYNTFGDDNLMSIDQRGFKEYIQAEANDFLDPSQLALNALVQNISYSNSGVSVVLADGQTLTADYALCTFSLGVLQHDDVRFVPELPQWKEVRAKVPGKSRTLTACA